jgi:hypothetical protein
MSAASLIAVRVAWERANTEDCRYCGGSQNRRGNLVTKSSALDRPESSGFGDWPSPLSKQVRRAATWSAGLLMARSRLCERKRRKVWRFVKDRFGTIVAEGFRTGHDPENVVSLMGAVRLCKPVTVIDCRDTPRASRRST